MKLKYFLILLLLSFYILNSTFSIATVRYVSKTGSSTPPYTSWASSADSIQKCINVCVDGDTIYVGNGVYKEVLVINRALNLIGSSVDSTIIDGENLINGHSYDSLTTIRISRKAVIENFTVKGYQQFNGDIIWSRNTNEALIVRNCIIERGGFGVAFAGAQGCIAEKLLLKDIFSGLFCGDFTNTSSYTFNSNIIVCSGNGGSGIRQSGGGSLNAFNNVIIHTNSELQTYAGISLLWPGKTKIKNNLVAGFLYMQYQDELILDSVFIENNVFGYSTLPSFLRGLANPQTGEKTIFRNNILLHGKIGLQSNVLSPDYNLYWDITQKYKGNITPGSGELEKDPMIIKDTSITESMAFDFHLQKYSPAIDAGDPNILDVDGSRSDIGMFGGPGGESYTYEDLAPRQPRNLSAEVDTNYITLRWNRNTEADTAFYKVYRDTLINFTIDSTKLISSPTDTFFVQVNPHNVTRYVYKVTCVDNQGNGSLPSEERVVNITSIKDYPIILNDYFLYQNYPNPFNPTTKIGYKLKERGYVKVMVYDIKGELVKVLVNKEQEAGYYEVEFNVGHGLPSVPNVPGIASGIYLFRIEVIGEGKIPVFSDMKKMMLLK